jgi:hypothetical protein
MSKGVQTSKEFRNGGGTGTDSEDLLTGFLFQARVKELLVQKRKEDVPGTDICSNVISPCVHEVLHKDFSFSIAKEC